MTGHPFISLHLRTDGTVRAAEPVWVAVAAVQWVRGLSYVSGALVCTGTASLEVTETPEQVLEMIRHAERMA